MLRKLNISLGIIAIIGILLIGGLYFYNHFNTVQDSKLVKELEGGIADEQ